MNIMINRTSAKSIRIKSEASYSSIYFQLPVLDDSLLKDCDSTNSSVEMANSDSGRGSNEDIESRRSPIDSEQLNKGNVFISISFNIVGLYTQWLEFSQIIQY